MPSGQTVCPSVYSQFLTVWERKTLIDNGGLANLTERCLAEATLAKYRFMFPWTLFIRDQNCWTEISKWSCMDPKCEKFPINYWTPYSRCSNGIWRNCWFHSCVWISVKLILFRYQQSSWGWHPQKKKRELTDSDIILVRASGSGDIAAFCSFQLTDEETSADDAESTPTIYWLVEKQLTWRKSNSFPVVMSYNVLLIFETGGWDDFWWDAWTK